MKIHHLALCALALCCSLLNSSYAQSIQHPPAKQQADVIIIGAGVAGLAAAKTLTEHHLNVVVLEAKNRVGGRVWTVYRHGMAFDLGASWVHGVDNNPLTTFINQYGLKMTATIYDDNRAAEFAKSYVLYDQHGKKYAPAVMNKLSALLVQFEHFIDNHNFAPLADVSIAEALQQFLQHQSLSTTECQILTTMVKAAYEYEYGEDIQQLSVVQNRHLMTVSSGKNLIFDHGYSQIVRLLAKDIPIQLNTVVNTIRYDSHGVTVTTNQKTYHAAYAIVTLPLGVLQQGQVTFTPRLPDAKLAALRQLKMSTYDKIYLKFNRVFWDKNSEWIGILPHHHTDGEWIDILNYNHLVNTPVLLAFASGSFAREIETWSNSKIQHSIMTALRKAYGNVIPDPQYIIVTRWNRDPYAKGSYSYLPAHVNSRAYKMMARQVMGRLFFAGEATTVIDPSTVHGAYLTGLRAAQEVIASTEKQPA